MVGLLSLPPWTVCLRSVQTLSVSFPKFSVWSPWLNNHYKSSYMHAYFKSSLNILISKKILSQYPHVRENTFSISSCQRLPFSPSSPPTQQNQTCLLFLHSWQGVKIYLVQFHRESFFIYETLSPLFALDLPQPQTKLKLSSSTKVTSLKESGKRKVELKILFVQESLKAALKQAEARLEEDKTAVKAQKRETKV